jgi:hypothetical protein
MQRTTLKIAEWVNDLDEIAHDFMNSFGDLDPSTLNWKPSHKTWSIAQNIDHLIRINESYFPQLEEMHMGRYQPPVISRLGFLLSFFGKSILQSVQPGNDKKRITFPIWEPTVSDIDIDIIKQFTTHQEKLKQKIKNSADLIAQNAIIASPANKWIVYRLETAFNIIILHERRHLKQSQALLDQVLKSGQSGLPG